MTPSLLLISAALAGAPKGFTAGVEGQSGFGPPAVSADGSQVALTRWDRVGLWTLDEDGALTAVSPALGAGFHPVWDGDALLTKIVVGGPQPTQQVLRWEDGRAEILDRADRVGQPAVLAPGDWLWVHGDTLWERGPDGLHALSGVGDVDLVAPSADRIAWDDAAGALRVRSLATGRTLDVDPGHPGSHPAWSGDGTWLLHHTPTGEIRVVDPDTGALQASVRGTDPSWIPGTHTVVFERVRTGSPSDGDSPYQVVDASLWSLNVDTGAVRLVLRDPRLHPRYPTPVGTTGDLLFVDSRTGDLWRLEGGRPIHLLDADATASAAPPPPPAVSTTAVTVPYMHQLWDTPDSFDGNWSCGPTSTTQVVAMWGNLPSADMTCSWPYSHTSHWGWYIPNAYSFNGYTYDTWGTAAGGSCQGAHGFVCRDYGGAVWAYIVSFLQQHGVDSAEVGTDYNSVLSETNAGYPMVASVYVLGYGHILVIRGYLSVSGSAIHSIVVNDPYGNAGSGDWGNFDGDGITYDWPGYNNGHLEIEVAELFTAHGVAAVVDPGPTTPVDTGTATPVDTGTAPSTTDSAAPLVDSGTTTPTTTTDDAPRIHEPGSLTEVDGVAGNGCATGGTAPSAAWMMALAGLLLRRRRIR